jgi:glycerophosphoryl diester phosphodiesterase
MNMKIIAHRNETPGCPENSIASLEYSAQEGIYVVECDVRRTGDGQYVIYHDETTERLTGIDKRISEMSLAEMKEILKKVGREVITLDEETLPEEESAAPAAAPEGETTKEFGAVTPAQIIEREQEIRKEQKRETRRELRMIMAVILAVLLIVGSIIYLALRRSIHNDSTRITPGTVCVIAPEAAASAYTIEKGNAHVRS